MHGISSDKHLEPQDQWHHVRFQIFARVSTMAYPLWYHNKTMTSNILGIISWIHNQDIIKCILLHMHIPLSYLCLCNTHHKITELWQNIWNHTLCDNIITVFNCEVTCKNSAIQMKSYTKIWCDGWSWLLFLVLPGFTTLFQFWNEMQEVTNNY